MDIPENTLGVLGLVVLLLLVFVVFFVMVFGGVFVVLRNTARQKEARARARYPNARQIDRAASFFGQESRGGTQMRGNGTLLDFCSIKKGYLNREKAQKLLWISEFRQYTVNCSRI